jgi:hypothetical protein
MRGRGGIGLALILTASIVASGLLASPASANVLAVSTFDSDTEGWTAVTIDSAGNVFPSSVSLAAGLGNPGGALRHNAPSDSRTSYLVAPPAFVNALRNAIGGSIWWDLSTINTPQDIFFTAYDIDIRAGGNHIRRSVTPPAPPISPTYARYALAFEPGSGWEFCTDPCPGTTGASQVQINAVLAGAEGLMIRGEYWSSATPDTSLLDNVIVAGPGVGVALNRATVAPGDSVDVRVITNPPLGPVDVYVVVALPQSLASALGCGASVPLVFISNAGSALTPSCLSKPTNTFPRFVASTTLSSGTLLSIGWPGGAPSGVYTFAVVATPPAALADGILNPGDIISLGAASLTVP